jgi:hypothetical protein
MTAIDSHNHFYPQAYIDALVSPTAIALPSSAEMPRG